MKQRTQLVAPPLGTMKRWWDAGYGFMRGLEKVRPEVSVTVLAYNRRRGVNLVEMPRLLAALGEDVLGRSMVVWAASGQPRAVWPAIPPHGLGRRVVVWAASP
jgi:hypothetical protein